MSQQVRKGDGKIICRNGSIGTSLAGKERMQRIAVLRRKTHGEATQLGERLPQNGG